MYIYIYIYGSFSFVGLHEMNLLIVSLALSERAMGNIPDPLACPAGLPPTRPPAYTPYPPIKGNRTHGAGRAKRAPPHVFERRPEAAAPLYGVIMGGHARGLGGGNAPGQAGNCNVFRDRISADRTYAIQKIGVPEYGQKQDLPRKTKQNMMSSFFW